MDPKQAGRMLGLVLWPVLACLAIWVANGSMPPAIEEILVSLLWGLVAILLVGVCGAGVFVLFGPIGRAEPSEYSRLDRVYGAVTALARAVMIVGLLFSDHPHIGGLFALGFFGMWGIRRYVWSRAAAG